VNLKRLISSEDLRLWLCGGSGDLGFDERSLGAVSKGSGLDAGRAVRIKLEILIQILQKGAVIFLAIMYVSEQEVSFRGIALPTKRFLDTFLGLLHAVQGE